MCPHLHENPRNMSESILVSINRMLSYRCVRLFCYPLPDDSGAYCINCYFRIRESESLYDMHFHGIILHGVQEQLCLSCGINIVREQNVFECTVCHPQYIRILDQLWRDIERIVELIYDSIGHEYVRVIIQGVNDGNPNSD